MRSARATTRPAVSSTAESVERTGLDEEWTTQLFDELCIGQFRRARLRDDDEVAGNCEPLAMEANELTQASLDSITHDRVTDFPTHTETESRFTRRNPFERDDYEVRAVAGPALFLDGQEIPSRPHAEVLLPTATTRMVRRRTSSSGRGAIVDAGHAQRRAGFAGTWTVRRLRPFLRRRLSTLRPPGVSMRARNPCVRLRRKLLG
jgi:hypothetical protein